MRGITPHGKAGTQVPRPDGRRKEGRHAREEECQRKDRKRKMDKNRYADKDGYTQVGR